MMGEEELRKRLSELREKLKQTEANGNAIIGAIAECEYWIQEVKKQQNNNQKEQQ